MQLPGTRNLHTARQHSKGSPYIGGPLIVRLHAARQRPKGSPLAKGSWQRSCLRVLTKSRKNEALIRNDGVYVISGIFCRANACVCGKNAFPSRPLAANRQICKRSGRFVGKPKVCQRSVPGTRKTVPGSLVMRQAAKQWPGQAAAAHRENARPARVQRCSARKRTAALSFGKWPLPRCASGDRARSFPCRPG